MFGTYYYSNLKLILVAYKKGLLYCQHFFCTVACTIGYCTFYLKTAIKVCSNIIKRGMKIKGGNVVTRLTTYQ